MVRRIIIEAVLVPESIKRKSATIKKEILQEFAEGTISIPWIAEVKGIRLVE